MKSLMRTVLVLSGLVICTSATLALDVVFSPNPLVFNPGETTKTVTVQFKDIPAGTAIANIGFYFTYDKTHVALSNPQWKISTDQTVPPVDRADGMVIMAAAQSQPVQGPQTTVNIVELTVTLSNVNPGDQFEIGFKTSAAENGLLDPDLNAVAANWGTCNVQVSTGPPNPPSVESFDIRSPQKDPVQFTINLSSQGNVPTRVDVQYREKGTQTWTNIPQTAVTINGKVVTVNWDSPATDGQTKVYELRAMAWDREQHSDWSASAEITVDNQAPYIVSASGYQKTVTVRFNERVQKGPAETVANWEVKAKTTGTAANVTKAQLGTDGQTVTLTLASDLEENKEYTVTARNIVDLAGNQRAATSKDFVAVSKPRLVEVRFQGPRVIDVVFNAPIDPATLGQAKDWSLTPAVVITKVEWRAQDVAARLTLGADLSQYAQYTVTAPSTIKNPAGQSLGTDNTIQFRTPIWHLFAQGTHLLGIPGEIGGQRLRNVLGATAVAIWDEASRSYKVDNGGAFELLGQNGKGCWAKFGADTLVRVNNPLTGDVQVQLPAGWSIITNPFYNTSIDINNTGLPLAWYWDGRAYKLVAHLPADALNVAAGTTLEAWRGYFVYRQQESSITIRRQAQSTGVVESLALGGKNAALIQLVARAEGAEDAVNVCGVGESEVKVPNPPRIPGSVDIYFVNGDGEPLAMDVRTGGIAGQRWELVVETDLPNTQVTVSAPDLSRIPADYAVVLTDPSTGRKTYLRTSGGYVFTSGSDGARRRLILEVVPRGQTTVIGGVTAQQVGRGRVVVTYQLTGSAAVTAQVLNIAGRPIRTLVADKAQTAGQHTIGWNLDNEAGSPVPAGTYLIVLQARTEDGQQVKVVRPLAVSR